MKKHKKKTSYAKTIKSKCHKAPVEILSNLICGAKNEVTEMVGKKYRASVLVVLDSLDGDIWKTGFRGEIIYCPINDFDILPTDILDNIVSTIIKKISVGERVGLFCSGGHGRTGYIASCVVGKLLKKDDPIKYVRDKYCKNAVETFEQIKHIAEYLDLPELVDEYESEAYFDSWLDDYYWQKNKWSYSYSSDIFGNSEHKKDKGEVMQTCSQCYNYLEGVCYAFGTCKGDNEKACGDFIEND